jgi:cyclohexadienyl dehydratase
MTGPARRFDRSREPAVAAGLARPALAVALALVGVGLGAGEVPAEEPAWRVGTSGDYAPFSVAPPDDPTALDGFSVALARAFAADTGRPLRFVPFHWPELARGLVERRFDVALSGVTVRPERSVVGRFGVPVAESGAVVLARTDAIADPGGLDREGVRIVVNAGGHLERVARARFPRAELRALDRNRAVLEALARGEADAAITDTLEAPHWERELGRRAPPVPVVRRGPLTRDRKAPWWRQDLHEEAFVLDAWLLALEADGTLAALRERHLGAAGPPTATPGAALRAAVSERLALMPEVARAKRATRRPVRDADREARVLEAAVRAVARRAAEAGAPEPDPARVEAFYRAQIEAAVAVQEAVLADPPAAGGGPVFDLQLQLRPALLRLGDRIAWSLVRLRSVPDRLDLRRSLRAEWAPLGVGPEVVDPLADAWVALAQDLETKRAISPASTGSSSDAP